jgi:hypothetical protein
MVFPFSWEGVHILGIEVYIGLFILDLFAFREVDV